MFLFTLDLARYILTTTLVILAGSGLMSSIRLPLDAGTRLLLAPAFGQSLWAIALGVGISLGVPVHRLALPIWGATIVFALLGARQLRRDAAHAEERRAAPSRLILSTVWLAPVLVLGPFFWHHLADYPGSGLPDGWAYVTYGQYLWELPVGTEGGLSPAFQYASTLSSTRNVGSAQLALLAMLTETGDVQRGFGLLQAVGLFSYGAAVAAFCRQHGPGRFATSVAIVATVISGWTLNLLWANNLDNLLALIYVPSLALLTGWPRPSGPGWWFGGAVLAAALIHTYPEVGLSVLGCAALPAGIGLLRARTEAPRRWLIPAVAAVVLFLALMPPVGELRQLLERQADAASAPDVDRPGDGMFLGLIAPRHVLAGWWALGSEHGYEPLLLPRTLLAAGLSTLVAVGVWTVVRERRSVLLVWLAFPLALAPFFAAFDRYSYGAYKAILIGWWFLVFLAICGAAALTARRRHLFLGLVAWLMVAGVPAATFARLLLAPVSRTFRMPRPASMTFFRQVQDIETIVGSDPVLIAVQDEEASEWAVYYLRDLKASVLTRDRYMVPKAAALARSAPVDRRVIRWVLLDANRADGAVTSAEWTLRWRGGAYALWETPPGAGVALEAEFADVQP